jgi:hypothetical protein
MIENIHIAIQRSTESNFSLTKFLDKYKKATKQRLQSAEDNKAKLIDDAVFAKEIAIFLSKELHYFLNTQVRGYFCYHPPSHLHPKQKEGQELIDSDDQDNHWQSLKLIEKAVNSLRRRFGLS